MSVKGERENVCKCMCVRVESVYFCRKSEIERGEFVCVCVCVHVCACVCVCVRVCAYVRG